MLYVEYMSGLHDFTFSKLKLLKLPFSLAADIVLSSMLHSDRSHKSGETQCIMVVVVKIFLRFLKEIFCVCLINTEAEKGQSRINFSNQHLNIQIKNKLFKSTFKYSNQE